MSLSRITWAKINLQYRVSLPEGTRVTRRGLRQRLVAIRRVHLRDQPLWYQIWQANVWASREAFYTWHVRIPSRYSDQDRARVAWLLRKQPRLPDTLRALEWSRQRG